jgi:biopolymer transport protein ExbD
MKITERYSKKARIEMIPLIDVIFLLLVAFIFFTMSMAIHKGLPVQLPDSSTAKVEKKEFVNITIKQDGTVYCNKENVSLPGLTERLSTLRDGSPDLKVLISGDKKASYEMIISVMDAVRKSGIAGVSLETEWEK